MAKSPRGARKASPKKTPKLKQDGGSKQKSPPASKSKIDKKSSASRQSAKSSRKFFKGESSKTPSPLHAEVLTPSGKKPKSPTSQPVIYGIRKGKKILKLDMKPQAFRQADLDNLNLQLKVTSESQKEKTLPSLAFFEVKTSEVARTKSGRIKTTTVKGGPLKGKRIPVYETRLEFKTPHKDKEWRAVIYRGNKFEHAVHPFLQKRNTYESVKSEVLNEVGFTKFKDVHSRFVAGFETKDVHLKGRTLTEALRHIQVPVSSLWLHNKKVVLKKFKDNQIGNIFVTGNAIVKTAKGKMEIPIQISSRYLGELPQEIGRKIRQALADNGVTYTSPKHLAAIQKSVLAKFKGKRGRLMTERARKEIARLTQPGANPKSAKLKTALDKVAKGKLSDANFPLKEAEGVTVNLRFSFYRDPLAKADKKKKKRGTKK